MPRKHDHSHDNVRKAAWRVLPIRFDFIHPTATPIPIAGTFNGSHSGANYIPPVRKGSLLKELIFGVGTLIGFLAARRRSSNGD